MPAVSLPLPLLLASTAMLLSGQLLPPPRDGDIRTAYWELRNESEVWLTLEPLDLRGGRAPLLTFTYWFPGKRQTQPATDVELRAFVGPLARMELWLLLDGARKVDLGGRAALVSGTPSDYLAVRISLDDLREIAGASRIEGQALGIGFTLTEAQRKALAAFFQRATGNNDGVPVSQPSGCHAEVSYDSAFSDR